MEAASKMGKNLCSCITLASGILACLVLSISIPVMAAPAALISDSGQKLSSVFEELKPNPAFQTRQFVKLEPLKRPWPMVLPNRLPGLLRVRIEYGNNYCPVSACSGNYTNFEAASPGSCLSTGCDDIQDFFTDFSQPCTSGEMDSECGDGSGVCCANAQPCDNYRGCPAG